MAYLPIENYGVIGNLHTVALVGTNGSIDWMCMPHFDSPSVFGSILDERKGGRFQIAPTDPESKSRQLYWPDTNVLVTRFLSHDGAGEVTDYMPIGGKEEANAHHQLVRRVTSVRGSVQFRLECSPAFNYARDAHETKVTPRGATFESPSMRLGLRATVPLQAGGSGVTAEFVLKEGQSAIFILGHLPGSESDGAFFSAGGHNELFEETVQYWRRWLSKCTYSGRWREMVTRSALVLKLLTFEPTGAIVAAATTSLPEHIGGERNWDYRYTWIRDAAFTVYALMRIGLTEEAAHFMRWIEERSHELNPDGSLQIMYGVDGRHRLTEETLDHLEGYMGSSPVRIGNGAYDQLQLDIYGEMMDSVYLYNKYGAPISYDYWIQLRKLVDWVTENWQRPDEGVWEVRGGRKHFVYSKVMCWVAVDRALRLADKRSFPADRARWQRVRDQIYEEIMERGWDGGAETFVQAYGSKSLDAANLIMPLVLIVSPTDPRMLRTLEAIGRSPARGGLVSNGLVFRYNNAESPDGMGGEEGTFNICTFWLVEAMTRAGQYDPQKLEEARLMFEHMLGYANHLGLYAEETGPRGEALGNFPQAFTHLSLISAAFNLDRALGGS